MPGSISLLVNPAAGSHGAVPIAGIVSSLLRDAGYGVRQIVGRTATESVELTRASVRQDTVAVVCIGGDGSLQLATQAVAGTSTPLGVIPAGTGNDFADVLGLPTGPAAATAVIIKALRAGSYTEVDLGRTGETWWLTVLCAGFDSAVSERANLLRWPRGPRRYDVAILAETARLRTYPMTITMDEQTLRVSTTLVAVGNVRQYGGGKQICPAANPSDGLLDVTVVGAIGRTKLLRLAPLLSSGAHVGRPEVRTYRTRRVSISLDDGTPLRSYADGEPMSMLPITTECIPSALRVLSA